VKEELSITGLIHSRLRAHLPPIADVLNRWSEKKGTMSLWTTLGFPKSSSFPSNLRLLCKFLALFIISRLQKDDEAITKTIDEKFANWSTLLSSTLQPFYFNKAIGLDQITKLLVELTQHLLPEEMDRIPTLYTRGE
jgi:hypothetical protein